MQVRQIEKILNTLNILYIEPNITIAQKIQKALLLKCDDVFVAHNIKDAVAIYNNEKIDIIVTEIEIPNENGEAFISSIRNINKNIPIIIITNVKDLQILLNIIPLHITQYILKPIDISIFKEALYNAAKHLYDSGYYEISFLNGSTYNIVQKSLFQNEKNITLTPNEIKFLDFLIINKNAVLPKDVICNYVWEDNLDITEEAFKSLLNRIRKKIGKESIKNISGYGYRLSINGN